MIYRCCGATCKEKFPDNGYTRGVISKSQGFIFCSEACAANPIKYPDGIRPRDCILYLTKEMMLLSELGE